MTNQMIMTTFFIPCDLSLLREPIEFGLQVSPAVLGYEIDAAELASEMRLQTQGTMLDQAALTIDPDEFETIFTWFLA